MENQASVFEDRKNLRDIKFPLNWELTSDYITINPDAFIYEGDLQELLSDGSYEYMHYILTKETLIKCRITHANSEPNVLLKPSVSYIMKINLPFLTKFKSNGRYGLKLCSGKSYKRFLTDSKEERKIWFDSLRELCLLTDFDRKYTIEGILGYGGSADVKLAKHNKTGLMFAVKFISTEMIRNKPFGSVTFHLL